MSYLHLSCSLGNLLMVQFLLTRANIDVNKRDFEGNTPLYYALRAREGHQVVNALLADPRVSITRTSSSPIDEVSDTLFFAFLSGDLLLLNLLIVSQRKDVDWTQQSSRKSSCPYEIPAGVALLKGHTQIVELLRRMEQSLRKRGRRSPLDSVRSSRTEQNEEEEDALFDTVNMCLESPRS